VSPARPAARARLHAYAHHEHQRSPPRHQQARAHQLPTPPPLARFTSLRAAALSLTRRSLSSPFSQPTSACTPAAAARPQCPPNAARRASSTATRRPRPSPVSYSARKQPHHHERRLAHPHRPSPGEPSGFLVVPGRAEGVRAGPTLLWRCCPPPLSHCLLC
jgi:hypothetical protein